MRRSDLYIHRATFGTWPGAQTALAACIRDFLLTLIVDHLPAHRSKPPLKRQTATADILKLIASSPLETSSRLSTTSMARRDTRNRSLPVEPMTPAAGIISRSRSKRFASTSILPPCCFTMMSWLIDKRASGNFQHCCFLFPVRKVDHSNLLVFFAPPRRSGCVIAAQTRKSAIAIVRSGLTPKADPTRTSHYVGKVPISL
jgi:hypothetical protein